MHVPTFHIYYLTFTFLLGSLMTRAQHEIPSDTINLENKVIPEKVKEATLFALKQYPELADTPIEFRFTKNISKSFMQAQPRFRGVVKNKSKRGYIVKITPALQLLNEQIRVENLPHDVLIGWIGHELGHLLDYQNRSGMGMIFFGCGYVFSRKYKVAAEKRADVNAIEHGLGEYIHATKQFIVNHADIPESYKEHIKKYYMTPEQVMEIINEIAQEENPVDAN